MTARMVITIEPQGYDESMLARCAQLASDRELELSVRLVEDQDLFDIAALPFTREVVHRSAALRDLSPSQLQQRIRLVSARLTHQLEQLQQALRLRWTLAVARGRRIDALQHDWQETHLWVTGNPRRTRFALPTYGNGHPPGVMLLHNGGNDSVEALAIASQLARSGGWLDILTLPQSDLHNPMELPPETRRLPHLHLDAQSDLDIPQISRRLSRHHADTLVLPAALIWPDQQPCEHPLLALPGVQLIVVHDPRDGS